VLICGRPLQQSSPHRSHQPGLLHFQAGLQSESPEHEVSPFGASQHVLPPDQWGVKGGNLALALVVVMLLSHLLPLLLVVVVLVLVLALVLLLVLLL